MKIKVMNPKIFLPTGTYQWDRRKGEVELAPNAEGVVLTGHNAETALVIRGGVVEEKRAGVPLFVQRSDGSIACAALPRSHIVRVHPLGWATELPYIIPLEFFHALRVTRGLLPNYNCHCLALVGEVDGVIRVVYRGEHGGRPFVREGVVNM